MSTLTKLGMTFAAVALSVATTTAGAGAIQPAKNVVLVSTELDASHVPMISKPRKVAAVIEQAAASAAGAAN